MTYDVPDLLSLSQMLIWMTFTNSPPGDIPEWRAKGPIICSLHYLQHRDRRLINHFACKARFLTSTHGTC